MEDISPTLFHEYLLRLDRRLTTLEEAVAPLLPPPPEPPPPAEEPEMAEPTPAA